MPPFGWGNGKTLALPLTSGKSFASSSPRSRGSCWPRRWPSRFSHSGRNRKIYRPYMSALGLPRF